MNTTLLARPMWVISLAAAGAAVLGLTIAAQQPKPAPDRPRIQRIDKPPAVPDSVEDRELGFRISQLLSRISALSDRANPHKLATGKSTSDTQILLKNFAAGMSFPHGENKYATATPLTILKALDPTITSPRERTELAKALEALSNWDRWLADHAAEQSDPELLGGAVISSLVLARWRALDFPYIDCPAKAPFC